MIALLLNSGLGSRMGNETRLHPKCMTAIAPGETILSWQLHCLEQAGIREAVITTGHLAEQLTAYVASLNTPLCLRFVHNPDYRETNYIHSVHLARELLAGQEVVSLHGDLVMGADTLAELAATPDSAVAVDASLPLPEKDFKGRLQDGRVTEIGVNVFGDDCAALQPAYHLLPAAVDRWLAEIARFEEAGNTRVYAENAFNAAWQEIPLRALDMGGRLCAEIDNMADLAAVSARFQQEVRQ